MTPFMQTPFYAFLVLTAIGGAALAVVVFELWLGYAKDMGKTGNALCAAIMIFLLAPLIAMEVLYRMGIIV